MYTSMETFKNSPSIPYSNFLYFVNMTGCLQTIAIVRVRVTQKHSMNVHFYKPTVAIFVVICIVSGVIIQSCITLLDGPMRKAAAVPCYKQSSRNG